MPNDGRKQNNSNFLATAAVGVAIGAIAAVGGYFFGKATAEEEAAKVENQHQQQRANTSSHASRSQQHARQRVTSDGDDLKKSALGFHDARECGICFRDFEEVKRNDEAIHTTPCGHVYCHECLQESLMRNPVCPSCRFAVLPNQTLRVYL